MEGLADDSVTVCIGASAFEMFHHFGHSVAGIVAPVLLIAAQIMEAEADLREHKNKQANKQIINKKKQYKSKIE